MAVASSAKSNPKARPKGRDRGRGKPPGKGAGKVHGSKEGKKVVKKRGKKGLEKDELKRYLEQDRALTPVDPDTREKKPRNLPLPHLSHLLRAEVNLFQHNQLNALLVAACLPSEPISNLKHCGIEPALLLAPEICYAVNQHEQGSKVQNRDSDSFILDLMLEQDTTIQSYVKGAVFELAENNLVVRYHADGLDSDTAMDDNTEEEDEAYAWPSETFKTLRWLTVQLMAFDDALPCSWHNYHEGKMTDQEPTLMHLDRMLERTDFSGNGAKMLEHVDKTIRGLLQTFCEEFGEEPLNVIPDWWSQSSRILDWKLKDSTRAVLGRFLFGNICMEPHPDQLDSMLSTLKEPYALTLKAQEARYAARFARSIKGLHQTAMPYRESYLALAICARLASIDAVRAAIFDPGTNLLRVLSKFVDGLVMTDKQRKVRYRWSQNWVKEDSTLAEAAKSMKTHSPEWHLYYLAQGCSLTAFDTIFEQRRSKISQALLEVILPLSMHEMINIFNRLNGSNIPLDIDFIAFHQHSFVTASDHVGKWIGKHPQVERGELGLSLVWNFYKDTAAHIALIGNNLGPYVAWESLKLLDQYTAPEAVLNVDTRAVVADATAQILGPLHLYDETTRTLGVGDCQVSERVIGHLMGFDGEKMHWPNLRKSDVGGVPGIIPTRSQMLGAFSIISAIYAGDPSATEFSRHNGSRNGVAQFVNDTVGMGKTLQAFMVVTGLFHIRQSLLAHHEEVDLGDDTATLFPYITRRDRGYLAHGRLPMSIDRETREGLSTYPTPPGLHTVELPPGKGMLRATPNDPILIVVPKSVINQWQAEWTRFIDGSGIQWIRIASMTELKAKSQLLAGIDCSVPTVIITTYPVASAGWRYHGDYEEEGSEAGSPAALFHLTYSCLIADEAHRCRNITTDESLAMQALSQRASVRLFLSATAITNSVQDLVNVFDVMAHPALGDAGRKDVWDAVEEQLKQSDAARKKYRNTVLASLSPIDWYRHVQLPESPNVEQPVLHFSVMEDATIDPDAIYTQNHFQDLLTQRQKAQESKQKSFSAEEDKTQLVALSKSYRQTYENLDAIALAQVLRQLGPSILRRGIDSSVYTPPSFTTSGFLMAERSTHQLEAVLPVYAVQRRRYDVLPDQKERALVTQLLVANQPAGTETTPAEQGQGEDEHQDSLPKMSVRQRDAFYTLGRQASIYLKSAQYPGIPIEIKDGNSTIVASAKILQTIAIIKAIFEEDKDKPDSEKRKICIFVRWTSGFPLIQYHLLQAGLGSVCLTGSHSAEERDKIVQQVQQARSHPIGASHKAARALNRDHPQTLDSRILILSEAGGEGLNLTRISELIILDGMWTAADANQLEGRFRRRGQTLPVNIHYLETPGTADEPMKLALQQKALLYDITSIFTPHVVHDSIQPETEQLLEHLNGNQGTETRTESAQGPPLQQHNGSDQENTDGIAPMRNISQHQSLRTCGSPERDSPNDSDVNIDTPDVTSRTQVPPSMQSEIIGRVGAGEPHNTVAGSSPSLLESSLSDGKKASEGKFTFKEIRLGVELGYSSSDFYYAGSSLPENDQADLEDGNRSGADATHGQQLQTFLLVRHILQGIAHYGADFAFTEQSKHPDECEADLHVLEDNIKQHLEEVIEHHQCFEDPVLQSRIRNLLNVVLRMAGYSRLSHSMLHSFLGNGTLQAEDDESEKEKALPAGWFALNSTDDAIELFLSQVSFLNVRKNHTTISEANKKKKADANALQKKKHDHYLEEYQNLRESRQPKDDESDGIKEDVEEGMDEMGSEETEEEGETLDDNSARSRSRSDSPLKQKECHIDPALTAPVGIVQNSASTATTRRNGTTRTVTAPETTEVANTSASSVVPNFAAGDKRRLPEEPLVAEGLTTPRASDSRPLFFSQPSSPLASSPALYTRQAKGKGNAILGEDESDYDTTPRAPEPPPKRTKVVAQTTSQPRTKVVAQTSSQHSHPSAPAYEDDFFSLMESTPLK